MQAYCGLKFVLYSASWIG